MIYVLDASVAVAAARENEPAHRAAKACVQRVFDQVDRIVVPSLFLPEVASALARRSVPDTQIRAYTAALLDPPSRVATIGRLSARSIADVAIASKLRGADAAYVWLASTRHLPLVTLDHEMRERGASFCEMLPL